MDLLHNEKRAEEERVKVERDFGKLRRQQTGRGGLLNFVRYFWHTLEPKTRKMVEGWPLEALPPFGPRLLCDASHSRALPAFVAAV